MRTGILALALAGCADAPTPDADLVVSGFDGAAVSGDGWWVRERLHWPNGESPDETEHFFVLGDVDPCATWGEAATGTGDTCEEERASYAALGEGVEAGDLRFEFSLWDTRDGVEPHIAVEPRAGRYTPLDGPDADEIEFTFYGEQIVFDWFGAVGDLMDCSLADPWEPVPSQLGDRVQFELGGGALDFDDPLRDDVAVQLDGLTITDEAGAPVGELGGLAVFHACDVTREITPGTVTD